MIINAAGNLLESEADALVNTVNCVGVMGKGIALQFKQAFPDMAKAYEVACHAEEVQLGRMHVWESSERMHSPRYVINFPTKQHWRNKSRLEDIESGLEALVSEISRLGIHSIAVPPLGCGHGGLDWASVLPLIESAFKEIPTVSVYAYAPAGPPPAHQRVINTPKKPLNRTRALLLAGIRRYAVLGYSITQLEVQKVAYFLQEAQALHSLRYNKKLYGPYADNLNHVLFELEGHYLLGFTGDRDPGKVLQLVEAGVEQAETYLASDANAQQALDRVSRLMGGFETPYGTELLSSVHWVATQENASTEDAAVQAVHAWNPRKKKILEEPHLRSAWRRLEQEGWLAPAEES